MKQHYDIVIMGAGMVGSSLAIALLDQAKALNLNLALIESNPLEPLNSSEESVSDVVESQSSYQSSFDARATALAYGSSIIFQQLSVWEKLKKHVQPIEHIHVSDKGHFGAARLHAHQENVAALGYVVENKWLGDVLYQHIEEHANRHCLDFYCPASVTNIERIAGKTQLQMTSEKLNGAALNEESLSVTITTDLMVMADGGRSTLREQLGISYQEQRYEQHALVCNVEVDRAHDNIAYERFTDTGPIALLPLLTQQKRRRCGLIWTIDEQEIESILALDEKAFLAKLQQRFGFRAGRFLSVGARFNYPLTLQTTTEQVRAGVVIVGNAAHTLHPIAGQGFNLALRGVASLAQCIINSAQNQQYLGDYNMLLEYQQSRLNDQRSTIGFSDSSMRLFSNKNPILAFGRDAGLQMLDICQPAKTVFARHAMGLASPMSNLK